MSNAFVSSVATFGRPTLSLVAMPRATSAAVRVRPMATASRARATTGSSSRSRTTATLAAPTKTKGPAVVGRYVAGGGAGGQRSTAAVGVLSRRQTAPLPSRRDIGSVSSSIHGRSYSAAVSPAPALTRRRTIGYGQRAHPARRVGAGVRMSSGPETERPTDPLGDAAAKAIAANNVMVFSATYCPYCARVKALFTDLGIEHRVWETDQMVGGDEVKAWLLKKTGQRTVPNIFIKGQHVGGCDDVFALHEAGRLRV